MHTAYVTTDGDGRLTAASTITIDRSTRPVPQRVGPGRGSRMAPHRIMEAVRAMGYKPYSYNTRYVPASGGVTFTVVPL